MKTEICRVILAAICIVIVPTFVAAQKNESGFLNRSVIVDGSEYRYVVYVPREFSQGKMWPVIVQLHGGGAYGSDGLKHTEGGLVPIWIFHGDADTNVDVEQSRKMNAALKPIGANVQYTELPGVDHNGATNTAYARADLIEWMLKQRRP